jgi:hypothetical protein
MKKARIFLFVQLFFINSTLMLLGGCFSRNDDVYCFYYKSGNILAWNNAQSMPTLVNDSGVVAQSLMLQLLLQDTSYLCQSTGHRYTDGAAYAFKSETKITYIDSIHIVSNKSYDASHPAGSNLIDLFSNPDLKAGIRRIRTNSVNFYLMYPPTDTGTHTFIITTFTADTLKNIAVTSLPIKLLL